MREDTKKIFLNTLWMLFDKVFILILNLIVTVKIANHFGKSGYGSYQYAVNVVALFEILVTFVDGRVVKKRYQNYDSALLVYNATICRTIFSILSAVIGLLFIIFSGRGREFTFMFSMLLLNMILINLRFGMVNRFEYILRSKKTVIAADISMLLSSVLQLEAVRQNWTITSISVIAAVSSAINLIIIYIQYKSEFNCSARNHTDKKLIYEMLKESLPLAVAASCAVIYTRCDSVMLGNMLSDDEVGIYSISVKLISIVQIAIAPIRESVYPQMILLYSENKKAYEKRYIQITSLMTWIYIIGVSASLFVLPFAFKFLKPEYSEAFPIYRVHVIGTFFMYNAALRAGHYTMINKGNILMYSQLFSVFANIIMNVIGINLWGMYGAALATIITQAVSLLFSNLCFGKEGKEVFKWQIKALNPMKIIK